MNRVSIRTLVLMLALLAYFVAYQCLAFIPPATTSGTTCAVRPADSPQAPASINTCEEPATGGADQPASSDDALAQQYVAQVCEPEGTWRTESTPDPNDLPDPNDSGSMPEIVE